MDILNKTIHKLQEEIVTLERDHEGTRAQLAKSRDLHQECLFELMTLKERVANEKQRERDIRLSLMNVSKQRDTPEGRIACSTIGGTGKEFFAQN